MKLIDVFAKGELDMSMLASSIKKGGYDGDLKDVSFREKEIILKNIKSIEELFEENLTMMYDAPCLRMVERERTERPRWWRLWL